MTRHDTRSKPSTLLSIALLFLAPAISGCRAVPPVPEPGHYGDFNTQVVARWQLDGRAMEVVYPLRFVDATGIRWEVPTGAVVDGASIPPVLWSFFGGPYEGLYRDASVVHDYACDHPDGRTWKQIHRMFWYGARARGETAPRAAVMYWAILIAGPPWSRTEAIELRKRDVLKARSHFEKHPPQSPEEIDALTLAQVRAMVVDGAVLTDMRVRFAAERGAAAR